MDTAHNAQGRTREKSQTNQYDLTLPQSICDVLALTNYRPAEPIPRGYRYPQSAHPQGRRPDKSSPPTRQNGLTDPSLRPSITGKLEHSVSSIRHRSDFVDTGALKDLLPTSKSKKGAIEEATFDVPSELEDFFHNFADRPRAFSAIRAFCQQRGGDITFAEITALVKAGKVKQSREGYWMDQE